MSPRAFLLACLLPAAVCAQADILYNNFGSNGSGYDTGNSYGVFPGFQAVAAPFIVPGQSMLTSVKLALQAGPTRNYHISVAKATPSLLPGVSVVSWDVSQAVGQDVFTLSPASPLLLDAGNYYLVAEANAGSVGGQWWWCNPHQAGIFALKSGSTWHTAQFGLPAYRIDANPVPEPASLLALGGLAVGFSRRLRLRRSGRGRLPRQASEEA